MCHILIVGQPASACMAFARLLWIAKGIGLPCIRIRMRSLAQIE